MGMGLELPAAHPDQSKYEYLPWVWYIHLMKKKEPIANIFVDDGGKKKHFQFKKGKN